MTIDEGRKPEGAPERSQIAGGGAPSGVDAGPKRYSVQRKLAVDAVSGRCRLCARRIADGVGFHRQASAPVSPVHPTPDSRVWPIRNKSRGGVADRGGTSGPRSNEGGAREGTKSGKKSLVATARGG